MSCLFIVIARQHCKTPSPYQFASFSGV